MKMTVCELRNDSAALEKDWQALVDHVQSETVELVLLPEMAFFPWIAKAKQFDAGTWAAAVKAHE